jgi:hypothetical protein
VEHDHDVVISDLAVGGFLGPLVEHEDSMSELKDYLHTHHEIHDRVFHVELQNDFIGHMWIHKEKGQSLFAALCWKIYRFLGFSEFVVLKLSGNRL